MEIVFVALGKHLLSFVTCTSLLVAFTWIYVQTTPYNEFEEISKDRIASAVSLGGAMFGFALPLLAAAYVGTSFGGLFLWGFIVGIVQLGAFWGMRFIYPHHIENNNIAVAIFFAVSSVCVGAFNAQAIIP
jgi:putative membrane protein